MQPVFFLALLLIGVGSPVSGDPGPSPYADELVARADAAKLYEDSEWLNLVHYKPSLFGFTSLVDDPKFFIAPDGKTSPQHEMDEMIRAFFRPAMTNELDHPVCRFVARFDWLKEKLSIDTTKLPVPECARFEKTREYLNATSVTLVFPAAYMNGPASMFGHTLLVFDAPDKNRLLSRAVSYAAKVGTRIGPLFAFAGIAGLYPGYYAIQPYYDKVEQYGDIGHRDVWEYELDFTPKEVERMMQHAWELQNIWSRYFFFDENCAYNLYFFLDVARPSLKLTDEKNWFVLPIDTVKAIDSRGLVKSVSYRPCTVTKIKHMVKHLGPGERELALHVAHGKAEPETVTTALTNRSDQIAVLDLASEYAQYLYTEKRLPKEEYSPRFIGTLRVRSKLGKAADEFPPVPQPDRPDLGHAPMRLSLGAGVQNDDGFLSLRGRIANHALLDNDSGYDKGSEIQFANTEGRYYFEREAFELQKFDVVQVESIAPRNDFFKPGSWKVNFGLAQFDREEASDDLVANMQTGAGLAYQSRAIDLYYFWIEGRAMAGSVFDEGYTVGAGPAAGFLTTLGKNWKNMVEARATYYGIGDEFWDYEVTWGQDYRLSQNCSVSLEFSEARHDAQDIQEAHVRLNRYF